MNRVYSKCPQCGGKECSDVACKFSGIKHEDMSACREGFPRGVTHELTAAVDQRAAFPNDTGPGRENAPLPTPDIGYECAWPR